MAEEENAPKDYEAPKGAETAGTWTGGDAPDGDDKSRPVSFVFNGGPGASSAYLHMGALGPQRVDFPADGTLPPLPPKLVENESSWLAFTDLVFVDPVGTGFSRIVE